MAQEKLCPKISHKEILRLNRLLIETGMNEGRSSFAIEGELISGKIHKYAESSNFLHYLINV